MLFRAEGKCEDRGVAVLGAVMLRMSQRKRAFHLLKVLDELDSVRKEYKVKRESLKTLSAKVDQLRVQQGECY